MGRGSRNKTKTAATETRAPRSSVKVVPEEVYNPSVASINSRVFYTGGSRLVTETDLTRLRPDGNQGVGIYASSKRRVAEDYANMGSGGTTVREARGVVSSYKYKLDEGAVVDMNAPAEDRFYKALEDWVKRLAQEYDFDERETEEIIREAFRHPSETNADLHLHFTQAFNSLMVREIMEKQGKSVKAFTEEKTVRHQSWFEVARHHGIQAFSTRGSRQNHYGGFRGDHQVIVLLDPDKLIFGRREGFLPPEVEEPVVLDRSLGRPNALGI